MDIHKDGKSKNMSLHFSSKRWGTKKKHIPNFMSLDKSCKSWVRGVGDGD